MPIEMPRGLPFSVDTWTPTSKLKRHHFLTHAHKDHLAGVVAHASFPVYATRITKTLVLHLFPQIDQSLFVEIEIGKPVVMHHPDGDFSVTAFDANHCPGAAMFLFEGHFGNLLHTGDCRLSSDCLQNLPVKYLAKRKKENLVCLDFLFLDCTFVRCSLKIPSKQSAIRQVVNCIWKHPSAPVVYLACDLIGHEDILVAVSKTFGSKIYVNKITSAECFQALLLTAPQILSENASSRFQVIEGFPQLYERASAKLSEARNTFQPEPLFIRASTQWYACENHFGTQSGTKPNLSEAIKDEFGVWHACYSMHSSREELESALHHLQPKWVISTTPPCRAMELDYVKKHCFKTHIDSNDLLWKLLKVGDNMDASSITEVSVSSPSSEVSQGMSNAATSSAAIPTRFTEAGKVKLKNVCVNSLEANMDSPPMEQPITLFGRARLGLCSNRKVPEGNFEHAVADINEEHAKPAQDEVVLRDAVALKGTSTSEIPDDCADESHAELCILSGIEVKRDSSCIGSSKDINASLRKLYRSMNVPVPRPLPSLSELMDVSKRAKIKS